ncbi:hypothetical protein BD780_000786 [Clostridium tetanomorphum]|uniref:Uncharacterized protein n=1 Tax=Clostridium tetanomorphum TaxID=1553 RepID=A0A923E727_CLOTT|nr:hypothetical protein [Clostridium tetanomorphum]KAJ52544.1 hypothetical protein CTM_07171 [Clostridium tetanomorphum DSM 665]MBC2396306.1 hypothetical protein [Clostridium tetanomorphum]MBP1863464.1 hypothetical protein [Clostridium tetanomorphum]NRS83561.1 hypothetical protein [Clostridium tetanomorphum]NRZ96761.1 hypothetical protein [Clostridium tetanomorphum]
MNEQSVRCCESESHPTAAVCAYNKNCNILIVPDDVFGGFGSASKGEDGDDNKEASNLNKEELLKSIKGLIDGDGNMEVESKAVGEARIRNVNLNLIITL